MLTLIDFNQVKLFMKYLGLSLRARVCRELKDIRLTCRFLVLQYALTFIPSRCLDNTYVYSTDRIRFQKSVMIKLF